MRATLTRSLLLGALLAASGCGAAPDRFALTTPADPRAVSTPVSPEEREILRHWGEQFRVRDASGASRDFEVPAFVSNGESGWVELADRRADRELQPQFHLRGRVAGDVAPRGRISWSGASGWSSNRARIGAERAPAGCARSR